ncbi:MAG TPA: hypothetical protein DE179_07015 [Oceanospirillaceae bacterium]|nr:hypothetical protein [Oceanospirillaceae bacterium]
MAYCFVLLVFSMPYIFVVPAALRRTIVLCLMLLSGCVSSVTLAADLYVAEVPLLSDSDSHVKQAKSQAMALMITRLTGQKASLKSPAVKSALGQADTYISQISRKTNVESQQVQLKLGFDKASVNQLLRRSGMPIWAAKRANMLVWLVIEEHGIQEIIADGYLAASDVLQKEADARGLPLVLPLMDLTDQLVIGPSDVWGNFDEVIDAASARYQPHGLLLGRIFKNADNLWQGQGQIQFSANQIDWKLAAQTPDDLMTLIVENLGQELSRRFALTNDATAQQESLLHISGVNNLQAYNELKQSLMDVASITHIRLHSLQADKLQIMVSHQGSQDNLLISLGLQPRLQLLDGQTVNPYSAANSLLAYYSWL